MESLRTFFAQHRSAGIVVRLALIAVALPGLAATPLLGAFQPFNGWLNGFANAGVYVMLAIGLNIVVGKAGLLDLGFAAFFAIGAYAYAFGASAYSGLDIPFWFMLPIGAVVAAIFGVALGAPTLRLRGDYLAIVTLGFGEIVPNILLNSDKYTLGTNGISGLYRPELPILGFFNTNNPWPWFLLSVTLIGVIMIIEIGRAHV